MDSYGRLLITGGCGFIGTQLIAYLIQEHPAVKIPRMGHRGSVRGGTEKDLQVVYGNRSEGRRLTIWVCDSRKSA